MAAGQWCPAGRDQWSRLQNSLLELFRRPCRQQDDHVRKRHRLPDLRRILLDDHVRVRATCAEQKSPAIRGMLRPSITGCSRLELLIDGERARRKVDVRIQLRRMQRRHDLPVLHLQQDFGQIPRFRRRTHNGRCSIWPIQ
jgi:hypothetical protein